MTASKVRADPELLDDAVRRKNPVAERIKVQSQQYQIQDLREQLQGSLATNQEWRDNYLIHCAWAEDILDVLADFISSLDMELPEDVQKIIADHVEERFDAAHNKEAHEVWKAVKKALRGKNNPAGNRKLEDVTRRLLSHL